MLTISLHTIVPRPPRPLAGDTLGEPTSAPAASRGYRAPAWAAMAHRRWRPCLSPLLITVELGLLLGTMPRVEAVQPISGPPLPLTTTIVNNGSGNQNDPHVSGALVSYTDQSSGGAVHVHDLLTGVD